MTAAHDTESRLVAFQYHDGKTFLGVVPKVCKAHFTFPFRIQGVLGRDWLMISRGSGGPQSIPTYVEIL